MGKTDYHNRVLFLLTFLAIGIIFTTGNYANPALFFVIASLLACIIAILRIEDPNLRWIILAFLFLRFGLVLIQAYTGIDLPGVGSDTINFERQAWKNAQAWLYGGEGGRATGAFYYSAWIGILYIIFGRVEFIPQLINVYISLLTIYLIYRSAFVITASIKTSQLAALFMALIPTLNFYSAILLRETALIFFSVLSFYFLLQWMKAGKFILLCYSFLALVVTGALHGVIFLLFSVHLLFLILYSPREQKFRLMYWQLIPAAVFIGLAFILLSNYITYQLPSNITEIATPDFLRNVVERKTIGRSTYLQEIVPYTYIDVIWQTPLRVFYFLLAPFPWMIETLQDVLGFLDVLIYAILFCFAIWGGIKLWPTKKQVVIAVFLIVAGLVVMFAWGTTNYGTAWRHRQKLAPFVVLLASAGVAGRLKHSCLKGFVVEYWFEDEGKASERALNEKNKLKERSKC